MTIRHRHNLFRQKRILKIWGGTIVAVACAFSTGAHATMDAEQSYQALRLSYQQLRPQLEHNAYNAPVVIHSRIEHGKATGHVYAILQHSFSDVSAMLDSTRQWCDATTLHINIKLCTSHQQNDQATLSLYVGEKEYQTPDEAYRIDYRYRVTAQSSQFIQTHLSAKSGPMDSKDYVINVEAIPLGNKASFVHFSYSARYGIFSRLLINTYLATAGRNKVGFTPQGVDADGHTIYIKGLQGIIERNCMRYFLALQSYLDTLSLPANQRFEASLNEWYGYTLKYRRQLYEVDRQEYLDAKHREHANRLQLARNNSSTHDVTNTQF
jgi:hypothetical protein